MLSKLSELSLPMIAGELAENTVRSITGPQTPPKKKTPPTPVDEDDMGKVAAFRREVLKALLK